MRILFVYDNMYAWGGIQTLIARFSLALHARGHSVELLIRPRGAPHDLTSDLVHEIEKSATVHVGGDHWFNAPRSLRGLALGDADVIIPCNLEALLLAVLVQQHLLPQARIVVGVFGPREYCWRASPMQRRWVQRLGEKITTRLPQENYLFAMHTMAREMGECLQRDLSSAPVLPIAIDTDRFRAPEKRQVDRAKIVSMTRLTPYYPHHDRMIEMIRELRAQGHRFEYHAYGEGETRADLEQKVRAADVDDAVFFHGAVPYDRIAEVMRDAFLYIGNGTALAEAAACGVPALVAIESDPGPRSYGFFHETQDDDLGGYSPGHPEYEVAEQLLWLSEQSDKEYREIERASRRRAEDFGLGRHIPRLLDILAGASPFAFHISGADRVVARLDWLAVAALARFGVRITMFERHLRALPSHV